MKLFFLLGNQLFSEKYLENFRKDHIFFMAEDYQLCTYEKHHKQKILLFLSAMRSHADKLKKNKFKIKYRKLIWNIHDGCFISINCWSMHRPTFSWDFHIYYYNKYQSMVSTNSSINAFHWHEHTFGNL